MRSGDGGDGLRNRGHAGNASAPGTALTTRCFLHERRLHVPDWGKYPDTVLNFRTTPAVRVDLREPIGKDGIRAMAGIGLSGAFAVMTAQNPRGKDEDERANQLLAAQLDNTLVSLGATFLHVDACSPDGSHCEDSVAVIMDREVATQLARGLEQVAIFWFDGEKFWIVGALAGGDPVMLPRPV